MDQSIQSYLKPELDEASKVLLRAAEYIEEHGWCQHDLVEMSGRVCLMGAIYSVAKEDDARAALDMVVNAIGRFPSVWNDAPGRTQAEVVAKLREVARSFGRAE